MSEQTQQDDQAVVQQLREILTALGPHILIVLDELGMPVVNSNIPIDAQIGIYEITKQIQSLGLLQAAQQKRAEDLVKKPKIVVPNGPLPNLRGR